MFNVFKYFRRSSTIDECPELSYLNQRLIEINRDLCEQRIEILAPTNEKLKQLIEEFISTKTSELPKAQLEDRVSLWYPEQHSEIGGIIAYDGVIKSLEYHSIDKCKIHPYKIVDGDMIPIDADTYRKNLSRGIQSNFYSTIESELDLKDHKGIIIDWHTHPKGLGDPSNFDINGWTKLQQNNPNSEIYFVIRCPWKDSSNWYRLEMPKEKNA